MRVIAFASSVVCLTACGSTTEIPGAGGGSGFVDRVESFSPGAGAGFGAAAMPAIVLGPPVGGGECKGSTDVVSLGDGGSIVLVFDAPIVDGPGADFIVFENAFIGGCGGDPSAVFAEPAEVSVSGDGASWSVFPCTATAYPYGACAGWHPVAASPDAGVAATDPATAGGDPFDLADLGVGAARWVRIRDVGSNRGAPPTVGFDLDAIAVVHQAMAD